MAMISWAVSGCASWLKFWIGVPWLDNVRFCIMSSRGSVGGVWKPSCWLATARVCSKGLSVIGRKVGVLPRQSEPGESGSWSSMSGTTWRGTLGADMALLWKRKWMSINQSNPVLLKERVRIPRTRCAGGAAMLWGALLLRRGRLLSTVLQRWSPRHYPECRPQINHTLSNLASRTHPMSSLAVQDPSSQGLAWTSPYLSHHWNAWHAQTT